MQIRLQVWLQAKSDVDTLNKTPLNRGTAVLLLLFLSHEKVTSFHFPLISGGLFLEDMNFFFGK